MLKGLVEIKIDSSSPSAQVEDCVDLLHATNEVKLNISTLSSNSLIVPLTSDNISDHPFQALVNSSSTHCFINTHFTTKHSTQTQFCWSLFDSSMALPTPSSCKLSTCKSNSLLGRTWSIILCYSAWLRLLHCIRTQLAHLLKSIGWLSTGQYLIQSNSTCAKLITNISTLAGLQLLKGMMYRLKQAGRGWHWELTRVFVE